MGALIRVAENFLYSEIIASKKAEALRISNVPNAAQIVAAVTLTHRVAQPLRNKIGRMKVNSFFRCLELNRAEGSKDSSQHPRGEAIDFVPLDLSLHRAFQVLVLELGVPFDQAIIYPEKGFIHVSLTMRRENRNQVLMSRQPGEYLPWVGP